MITKVSTLIMLNYENFGLNKIFNENTKPILEYFLKKDIDVLIGKDEFDVKTGKPNENGLKFEPHDGMLLVNCDGIEYLIGSEKKIFFIMERENPNNEILFSYDEEENTYANIIFIENDNQSIREIQKISLDDNYSYEYQKTIATADGTINFPSYRLELLKEIDDKDHHSKLINTIELPKIDDNLAIYFENIFSILEASTISKRERILSII